jgi:hypothetical protein
MWSIADTYRVVGMLIDRHFALKAKRAEQKSKPAAEMPPLLRLDK